MRSISTIRSTLRSRSINAPFTAGLALLALCCAGPHARAAESAADRQDELAQLFFPEPDLELHEGPGRGYAVTQVVPRGEAIDVLYRRTEWFRVRTSRGVEGWAHESQLQKAAWADGTAFMVDLGDRAGFAQHRWEMGAFAGDYGGATLQRLFENPILA